MPSQTVSTKRRAVRARRMMPSPLPAPARSSRTTDVAGGLLLVFAGLYLALAAGLLAHDALRPALLSVSFAVWAWFLRDDSNVGLPLFLLMAGMDVAVLSRSHWPAICTGEIGLMECGLLLKAASLAGALAWGFAKGWRLDRPAHRGLVGRPTAR